MSYSTSKLGRLAVKTQAAWGTTETSFATTDYLECRAPFIPPLGREAVRTDTYRPDFTEPSTIAGSKTPTEITVGGPLHGWSSATPAGGTTTPTSFPDLLLMSRALGGITTGSAYTTALAGSSTTSVANITDGSASTAWEGYAQDIPVAGGRAIAWIGTVATGVSPDTLTYAAAIALAQSATGVNYGSILAYLNATTDLTPLTFQWLGQGAADQIRYFDGAVANFSIVLEAKKQPQWEATLRALDWTPVGSGGAPAAYAYGFPQMPAWTGTNGVRSYLAGTARAYAKVTVSITQDLVEVGAGSGNQGVAQWTGRNRRVTIECIRAVTDTSAVSGAPGDAAGVLQIDLGTTPGRAGSILVPAALILEQPTIVDMGGIYAERVLYGCALYASDGTNGTASNTAFRYAAM